ncbi:MAG: DUF6934 family protein [Bacteroidia bacterium]
MQQDRYGIRASPDFCLYTFTSEGPQGKKKKIIQFSEMTEPGVYNLAFGDWDPILKQLDDRVVSNNGDREKVLATVVAAVYLFTNLNPDCTLIFAGSTPARTRLYRMGIAKHVEQAIRDFEIFGFAGNTWAKFEINVDYKCFLIRRRDVHLFYE